MDYDKLEYIGDLLYSFIVNEIGAEYLNDRDIIEIFKTIKELLDE